MSGFTSPLFMRRIATVARTLLGSSLRTQGGAWNCEPAFLVTAGLLVGDRHSQAPFFFTTMTASNSKGRERQQLDRRSRAYLLSSGFLRFAALLSQPDGKKFSSDYLSWR